jgi:hypothetical protein
MPQVIFETCWNQKNRYSGIKEYYDIVKDVCTEVDSVELIGLFRPRTEPWNWAYFIAVNPPDTMGTWQKVSDEIDRRNYALRDSISQSFMRWYSENYFNPRPENLEQLKFLQIELDVWEGINVGVKEYFDAHVKVFEGQEGVWYQGQYRVWNEPYNWANFYWYRDWSRMLAMSDASWRVTGQPDRIPILIIRNYERYDPK